MAIVKCTVCGEHQESTPSKRTCRKCGDPLPGGHLTVPIPTQPLSPAADGPAVQFEGDDPFGQSLYLTLPLGRRVELQVGDTLLIGRHPDSPVSNDLAKYDSVSRRHAEVQNRPAGAVILDLNSTNGTKVDGRCTTPGEPFPLAEGSRVQLSNENPCVMIVSFRS